MARERWARSLTAPVHAGIPTFFRARPASCTEVAGGTIAILGVPRSPHQGTGVPSAARSIREASLDLACEIGTSPSRTLTDVESGAILRRPDERLMDLGDVPVGCGRRDVTRLVRTVVNQVLQTGSMLVVLNDHNSMMRSLVGPVLQKLARTNDRIGYVQVSDCPELSLGPPRKPRSRGSPQHFQNPQASLLTNVMVGASGYVIWSDWQYVQSRGIVISAADLRSQGIERVMGQVSAGLDRDCNAIFVTLNIDVVDLGYAPGQLASSVGGLTSSEFLTLARSLGKLERLRVLEVVGVAPHKDASRRTQRLAAQGIIELIRLQAGKQETGASINGN
jgi:arginase family enzyme